MPSVLQGLDSWFLNQKLTPEECRAALSAGWASDPGTAVGAIGGVVPGRGGTGLAVSQDSPTPSMKVRVAAGQCVIYRANQYSYVGTIAAVGTVDLDAADATNPRIDTIVARVRDSDLGDPTNGTWAKGFGIEVEKGTASGSPVPKDLTGTPPYLVLAYVTVGAGVTSVTNANISDQRVFTTSAGGIRYAYNSASRGGIMPWEPRINASNGDLEVFPYDGLDVWVPVASPGAWKSYTVSWTASTTNPVLGNGFLVGTYQKLGKTVDVTILLKSGSTTTYGSGAWSFSLPVAARTVANFSGFPVHLGVWTARDASASQYYDGRMVVTSGNNASGTVNPGIGNTAPFTWANGDYLGIQLKYEAA